MFVKGIEWTFKSRLVKSWCTVRVCLQCRVKARLGVRVLYCATIIKVGTVGAFWVSSSVPSFGCVPEKTYEHQQQQQKNM